MLNYYDSCAKIPKKLMYYKLQIDYLPNLFIWILAKSYSRF